MKKSKLTIIITVIILIVIMGVKYKDINNQYPQAKEEEYRIGDKVEYRGIEISVENVRLIDNDEINNMDLQESKFYEEYQRKAIVATVNFINNSNESKSVESDYFEAATLDWHNGLNYEIFNVLNGGEKRPYVELNPKEEITLQLPYEMFDFQFERKTWDNIEDLQFNLVLEIYPLKKFVNLD